MYFLLLLLSGLGLLPALIAYHKGHSFALWWVYGAVAFIIALPHALLTGSKHSTPQDGRNCPYCHESVPMEDEICPACHLHLYDPVLHGPPVLRGQTIGNQMTHRHA